MCLIPYPWCLDYPFRSKWNRTKGVRKKTWLTGPRSQYQPLHLPCVVCLPHIKVMENVISVIYSCSNVLAYWTDNLKRLLKIVKEPCTIPSDSQCHAPPCRTHLKEQQQPYSVQYHRAQESIPYLTEDQPRSNPRMFFLPV